jgi:DUSAM domain-containing protein
MTEDTDWDELRALAQKVLDRGASLEISEETRALLTRTARQVAIHPQDAQAALGDASNATTLLRTIRQRIREGESAMGMRWTEPIACAIRETSTEHANR